MVCLAAAWGFAQTAGHRITLDVVVTDKSGKPVADLHESDFTLLDNKKPQKLASFRAVAGRGADSPEVMLLVDAVNTAFSRVAFARDQIDRFLRRDNGELAHPVSLVFLTDSGLKPAGAPTRDGNALASELTGQVTGLRTFNRREGFYAADELLQISLAAVQRLIEIERDRPGRKLVVWISPGWPLLSGPGMELQMTEKQRQQIFSTAVAISDGLRHAGITIYDVDPLGMSDAGQFRTFAYEQYVKGVKSPSQVQYGNLALQVLAVQSGGRVFNSGNDITGEIAQCVSDGSAYYELSFAPPEEGPAEYHALEIKLARKGLTARTRTGYYAH